MNEEKMTLLEYIEGINRSEAHGIVGTDEDEDREFLQ